jgi:hypothetical protein
VLGPDVYTEDTMIKTIQVASNFAEFAEYLARVVSVEEYVGDCYLPLCLRPIPSEGQE